MFFVEQTITNWGSTFLWHFDTLLFCWWSYVFGCHNGCCMFGGWHGWSNASMEIWVSRLRRCVFRNFQAPLFFFVATEEFVLLLHRHGDRSPIDQLNIPDAVFQRQWPYGAGELTAVGMQQHYDLGVSFRKRYVGEVMHQFHWFFLFLKNISPRTPPIPISSNPPGTKRNIMWNLLIFIALSKALHPFYTGCILWNPDQNWTIPSLYLRVNRM